jgi:hypothetical protein
MPLDVVTENWVVAAVSLNVRDVFGSTIAGPLAVGVGVGVGLGVGVGVGVGVLLTEPPDPPQPTRKRLAASAVPAEKPFRIVS